MRGATLRGRAKTLIVTTLASSALAGAVLAPVGHAQLPTCPPGTTNTQYCQVGPPLISAKALAAACRSTGASVHLPAATITSVGGLKTVTVTLDGKRIKRVKTSSKSFKLKSITIGTKGLKAGLHTVVVTAVDSGGRTARRVFHFAICKPKPKFTG
jgi:hypothetical protein